MTKHYILHAVARKITEDSSIHSIEFPELDIQINTADLTPEQLQQLRAVGFIEFLQSKTISTHLLTKLNQMDANDESVNPLTELEIQKKFLLGPHDHIEPYAIDFTSNYRYSVFETIIPWVTRATLVAELTIFLPLLVASIGSANAELLSMNTEDAKISGMINGVFYTLFNLVNTFAGPGANYFGQLGGILDDFFHFIWKLMTCDKRPIYENPKQLEEIPYPKTKIAVKTFATISCFGYLFNDFLQNYRAYESLEAQVEAMAPYSYFSTEGTYQAMTIGFYLNQYNDPMFGISFLAWCFDAIDELAKERALKNKSITEEKQPNNLTDIHIEQPLTNALLLSINSQEQKDHSSKWCCLFNPLLKLVKKHRISHESNHTLTV